MCPIVQPCVAPPFQIPLTANECIGKCLTIKEWTFRQFSQPVKQFEK